MSSEKFIPLATSEEEATAYHYAPDGGGSYPTSDRSGGGFVQQLLGPTRGRENHLFCGRCCDVRRATLAVNILTIVMNLLFMIAMFFGFEFVMKNADAIAEDMDDDEAKEAFENFAKSGSLQLLEAFVDIFFVVSIALHAIGVYGALKYQVWAVMVAAISYGIAFTIALLGFNIMNMFLTGLFLYPHIVLIKEIKEGIMTDYNYERVRSCCDC